MYPNVYDSGQTVQSERERARDEISEQIQWGIKPNQDLFCDTLDLRFITEKVGSERERDGKCETSYFGDVIEGNVLKNPTFSGLNEPFRSGQSIEPTNPP